ncbi:type II toxin-antitoxin system HipA family toxin [Herbaspirillum seropedicae]|uniref:Capsule biosynthesis enzyme protein n=1 Tax=Herbaspirillum seropedicae (strain SmR1) TaxID=757424 RepID=D8IT44_HERSS|nr:type II toxin-antitoxin system HipA family toxin [Herbaspirillum seropedicae]ADJ63603.1 capsule biosynthesis enzyme protein [Herbaspirillum seropedicae SmR1]AKN65627.1 phosphatidylinositol kinase [Herbaspirillum seropedicae]NQE28786.1 phosphatidylinositol kinase [Herbaspirillum seropedicae]UMU21591.1 type II toxin-antitoxin system HipA family toxin [Herbaspirillum seropedicae]
MKTSCTLEVHIDGAWRQAGGLALTAAVEQGMAASTFFAYETVHAIDYLGRRDAAALSVNLPVALDNLSEPRWPAFLIDLLPQGYGRAELLRQLGLDERTEASADWPLLCAGAGNPIGNIRVLEAWEWVQARSAPQLRGFAMEEIAARSEDFNEYLAQHGLFLAGSSGVQGEWPKILLTRARDGLFYLDHALPDELAERHYIVKFGRGPDPDLADILRLEAPYMQMAARLGLHVHAPLELHGKALFIPRFDREVRGTQVLRHAQESIASLCGVTGFAAMPTHNAVCARLGEVATDPVTEIIEYLKRDIANIVLRNKDNHARNTAIRRDAQGRVGLTPLFDFAPMWLHPDGIARRMRWERDDGGSPQWASAIAQACEAAQIDPGPVKSAVREMALPLADLLDYGRSLGIESNFLDPLAATVAQVRAQLEAL